MFPKLKFLSLESNSFSKLVDGKPVPSVLPKSWTDPSLGFTSLSILTLYPGNEYLCSVPDAEGSFQSINLSESCLAVRPSPPVVLFAVAAFPAAAVGAPCCWVLSSSSKSGDVPDVCAQLPAPCTLPTLQSSLMLKAGSAL